MIDIVDCEAQPDRVVLLGHYREALRLTNSLVDPFPRHPKTLEGVRKRAQERLGRLRALLAELDNPHLSFRVIHVGGTSGKGSTSAAAGAILTAAGVHNGLHTSPYLQVATEKVQIDSRLINAVIFHDAVESVIETAKRSHIWPITYGEVWFALTALIFAREKIDVAVIEVGAGGRFDLTNVVVPDVSVITSAGLDHMETLGDTIEEIAWHKAGIIKQGIPIVSAVTDRKADSVIRREAEQMNSSVVPVIPGETFDAVRNPDGTYRWWERDRPDVDYPTSMPGGYQATNSATALAAVRRLSQALVKDPQIVRAGLLQSRLQGRSETVSESPTVILDGAHNPQKMAALVRDLRSRRSDRRDARLIAVVGVLFAKDHLNILREILKVTDELVTTSPHVLAKPGAPAAQLAEDARSLGFGGPITSIDDPMAALDAALVRAGANDIIIVTGSLYLVGNVRGRWFPDDEIVVQQTAWPFTQPAS